MEKELQKFKLLLAKKQGERDLITKQLESKKELKDEHDSHLEKCLKGRAILQIVAENTQKEIELQISTLVSSALRSVFFDPYTFLLKFVQRRNKTEGDLLFSKNKKETTNILSTGGGGVADISSLSLVLSTWSIRKTRPSLFLDEPTKYLHNPVLQRRASDLLKEITDELGVQLLVISDQKEMIAAADQVISITNKKGRSEIQ